jgi:hypothetical protein
MDNTSIALNQHFIEIVTLSVLFLSILFFVDLWKCQWAGLLSKCSFGCERLLGLGGLRRTLSNDRDDASMESRYTGGLCYSEGILHAD